MEDSRRSGQVNKKLYLVGPHNCPARRNLVCLINGEECHMMIGVECIFFDYELREKKRQLRKHKRKREVARWL
jgi:Zn ribbon nucleic-acid-binding protein